MTFDKEKHDFLTKKDKSKKGIVDKEIQPLVKSINTLPNYYTKSSCAGRIVLLHKKSEKKQESSWLFIKHGPVTYAELKKALTYIPDGEVWFKQEPLIMHVCCNTLADAVRLLKQSKGLFKRTGIIGIKNYATVEIIGTDALDTVIAHQGKILVSDDYLKVLITEANKKLKRNSKKINEFYKIIRSF